MTILPGTEIITAPQTEGWQDQPLIHTHNFIIHPLNPEVLFCCWVTQCTAYFWFDSIQRTFGLTFRFLESIYYSKPYKYKLMWSPVEKTHKIVSPLNNTKGIPEHKYKDILVLCFLFYENNLVFPCLPARLGLCDIEREESYTFRMADSLL